MHSWGAKETESVTEGITRKPKVHKSDKQSLSPKSEIYPENIVHFDKPSELKIQPQ